MAIGIDGAGGMAAGSRATLAGGVQHEAIGAESQGRLGAAGWRRVATMLPRAELRGRGGGVIEQRHAGVCPGERGVRDHREAVQLLLQCMHASGSSCGQ